jgi:hypothetical protein
MASCDFFFWSNGCSRKKRGAHCGYVCFLFVMAVAKKRRVVWFFSQRSCYTPFLFFSNSGYSKRTRGPLQPQCVFDRNNVIA